MKSNKTVKKVGSSLFVILMIVLSMGVLLLFSWIVSDFISSLYVCYKYDDCSVFKVHEFSCDYYQNDLISQIPVRCANYYGLSASTTLQ